MLREVRSVQASLRATALAAGGIDRPTLLLDPQRVRRHIETMARKARRNGVRFRPHFKTHQSAAIGAWFREVGVQAITVSSLDMAQYFATHGWQDITVAFPVNPLEATRIDALAGRITLHVLLDSVEAVDALERDLQHGVHAWIKVDVGKHRAGIPWNEPRRLVAVARHIQGARHLRFAGLLTHAGHSYDAGGPEAILEIHTTTHARMAALRQVLEQEGLGPCALSVGDTPCCTLASDFPEVDEIRPGNFVFYDLQQAALGVCHSTDIAVAVACPVVEKSALRRQLVLYGGAVHLSKDALVDSLGHRSYGFLAPWEGDHWGEADERAALVSLSQEHGLVDVDAASFDALHVGDLVVVLPAHSCLTSDLYKEYRSLDGTTLPRRRSNDRG